MKLFSKWLVVLLAAVMVFSMTACGGNAGNNPGSSQGGNGKENLANEDYFVWDNDYICGLSDKGAKQKSLVIPNRCVGFAGTIFVDKENSVEKVSFESDKNIELNGVFTGADKLKYIELPAELNTLLDMEFWYCTALVEITIPAGVKEISKCAFQDCTSLETVVFEGDVERIMDNAFDGCKSLKTIVFPDTVTEINSAAFQKCMALTRIALPKNLKVLGAYAFANSGLVNVEVPAEMELTAVDLTALAQADHAVAVRVTKDSWADQNFEEVFAGCCVKEYAN